jgi:hypothetical protein
MNIHIHIRIHVHVQNTVTCTYIHIMIYTYMGSILPSLLEHHDLANLRTQLALRLAQAFYWAIDCLDVAFVGAEWLYITLFGCRVPVQDCLGSTKLRLACVFCREILQVSLLGATWWIERKMGPSDMCLRLLRSITTWLYFSMTVLFSYDCTFLLTWVECYPVRWSIWMI